VAVAHRDPEVAAALEHRYPASRTIHPLLARVLRDGRSQTVGHGHEAELVAAVDDSWRPVAALLLPLLARERTLGVVSLFSFESGRRFSADDCAVAEDLARRIALGVDNARLYQSTVDAHRRFHDLVEGLGAIVWEADAVRRHYTFVSGRAVALLGHPLSRWHDEADFWLTLQHPNDREQSSGESRASRATARDHDLEYRVVTADGRILWMLDLVRIVRHPDGTVRQLRGVMVLRPSLRSRMRPRTRSTIRSPSSWATSRCSPGAPTRRPRSRSGPTRCSPPVGASPASSGACDGSRGWRTFRPRATCPPCSI
jgi:PAS domain-containing protein